MKKILSLAVAGSALSSMLFAPMLAFAQEAPRMVRDDAEALLGMRCEALVKANGKLDDWRIDYDAKLAKQRGEWEERTKISVEKNDKYWAEQRSKNDDVRLKGNLKVEAKLSTKHPELLSAHTSYKTSMDAALASRRGSVEKAHAAFLAAKDAAVKARQTENDAARAVRRAAVDAAVAKMKADCSAGLDRVKLAREFRVSIDAARKAFNASAAASQVTFKASMKAAQDARRASVKAAEVAYAEVAKAAKEAWVAAKVSAGVK